MFLPIATYGLGFDPHLAWGYAFLFGLGPIALTLPAILPAVSILQAFFGDHDRDQLFVGFVTTILSILTYMIISQWIYAPDSDMRTLALAVSSPFIGGVSIAVAAAILVAAACCVVHPYRQMFGAGRPRRDDDQA